MRWSFEVAVIAISLIAAGACSESDCAEGETGCIPEDAGGGQDGGAGSAPVISNLTYSPETGTAGQQVNITGTFDFTDSDGDAAKIATAATPPGGVATPFQPADFQGGAGIKQGTATFLLALLSAAAGEYTFEVWLIDAAGNESNHLSGTVRVE